VKRREGNQGHRVAGELKRGQRASRERGGAARGHDRKNRTSRQRELLTGAFAVTGAALHRDQDCPRSNAR
jgi:hypothetical protein